MVSGGSCDSQDPAVVSYGIHSGDIIHWIVLHSLVIHQETFGYQLGNFWWISRYRGDAPRDTPCDQARQTNIETLDLQQI